MAVMGVSVYALSVTRYAQEKTNWCWAACGEMVFNYIDSSFSKEDFSSRQQRIVSLAGKKPAENSTGSITDIINAGRKLFASQGQFDNSQGYELTNSSFATVTSLLSTEPVMISAYTASQNGGHSLVAYKYSSSLLSMHDPWSGASTIQVSQSKLITDGFKSPAFSSNIYGKWYLGY